jgi:hypothetical protein
MENSKLKPLSPFILFGLMISLSQKILDFTKVYRFPELAFHRGTGISSF